MAGTITFQGVIIGYNAERTKTVYDPSAYSDAQMLEYGKQAASENYIEAVNEYMFTGEREYFPTYNGVTFRAYLNIDDETNVFVGNIHPINPDKK